jgi:hypothetical protein
MSSVSTVTLQVFETSVTPLISKVNEWLSEHAGGSLNQVDDGYGGNKASQVEVYGGAFNHLDEDDFAFFVMRLPWEYPEDTVLLINPEEGPARVFRPEKA